MTPEEIKTLGHAFFDGKTLQYEEDNGDWCYWEDWIDPYCPNFRDGFNWRIKPDEPKKDEVIAEAGEMLAMRDRQLAANAALELEVASLRSVMADVIKAHGYAGGTPIEVMSTQFIPTALPELIEKGK